MQLDDGFPKIDLTEFTDEQRREPLNNADLGLVRICLVTEDLRRDVAHLKSEGVEFISEPQSGTSSRSMNQRCPTSRRL